MAAELDPSTALFQFSRPVSLGDTTLSLLSATGVVVVLIPLLRGLLVFTVFRPLGRCLLPVSAPNGATTSKRPPMSLLEKWEMACWSLTFYVAVTVVGLAVTSCEPWFTKPARLWYDCDSIPCLYPVSNALLLQYCLQLGFYLQAIPALYIWDLKRKDFYQMMLHHVATIGLICYSIRTNLVRAGAMILLIHDVCDVLMETAKLFRYAQYNRLAEVTFGIFVVVWIVLRIIYFPSQLIRSCLVDTIGFIAVPYDIEPEPHYIFLNGLLCLLYVIHIYWTYLILKIVWSVLVDRKEVDDVREDEEDGETKKDKRVKILPILIFYAVCHVWFNRFAFTRKVQQNASALILVAAEGASGDFIAAAGVPFPDEAVGHEARRGTESSIEWRILSSGCDTTTTISPVCGRSCVQTQKFPGSVRSDALYAWEGIPPKQCSQLRGSSRKLQAKEMYSVNDVIAGRYRVIVVHPTARGHTCVRFPDDAMATVECVALNGALLPNALGQYEAAQREMLKANSLNQRGVEYFETESKRGKVFHVVKAVESVTVPSTPLYRDVLTNRVESEVDIAVDVGLPTADPVETPVTPQASSVRVIRQRGLHLNVDVQPQYFCKGWKLQWRWLLALVLTVIWLLLTAVSTKLAYRRLKEGEFYIVQAVVVPCWIVGIWLLYLTVSKPFIHEYLQITATHFEFIRWFETPFRRKDSPSDFGDPTPTASFIDRLLLGQRRGRTADLDKAEIHEATNNFVLMEGNRSLTFLTPMSGNEQQWLVTQVNTVLEDIRNLCLSPLDTMEEAV